MTNTDKLREDIAYVRAAADRADATTIPSISLLWAAIVLCGYSLPDFVDDYRWIGRFWTVAGPAGLCLSLWLGYRAQRDAGQADRRIGIRWGLHWLAFLGPAGSGPHSSLSDTWSGPGSARSLCCC